jgi:predicted dinucleotide-binding enzyme
VEGEVAGEPLDVLVASDDEETKATVKQLVEDGGLRPVDAGPLARAHELETLGFLHMALQAPLGTQYGSTIKIVPDALNRVSLMSPMRGATRDSPARRSAFHIRR